MRNYLSILLFIIFSPFSSVFADEIQQVVKKFDTEVARILLNRETSFSFKITKEIGGAYVKWDYHQKSWTIFVSENSFLNARTMDSFFMLLCHEIGHVAEAKCSATDCEVSSEALADYWATKKCAPLAWKLKADDLATATPLDVEFKNICKERFLDKIERETCIRSLSSAYIFRAEPWENNNYHQNTHLPLSEAAASCTRFNGLQAPSIAQCGFNNLAAGTLGWPQPKCMNLILLRPFFGEDGTLRFPTMPEYFENQCRDLGL